MTIRISTANQIKDISRLGIKNKFGEILFPESEIEIDSEWEELIVYEGYFNSLGLKRLYFKDKDINTKDKYYTPYRSYMLDVCGVENTIVTQCVATDRIYLKIVGKPQHIRTFESCLRRDFIVEGMSDLELVEANRRDLAQYKRIYTFEVKFNKTPERFDKHGQAITNLDHYDNFFYESVNGISQEIIYIINNAEKSIIWLTEKLEYLEGRMEKFKEDVDREKAIRALSMIEETDFNRYIFRKSGKYIADNIDRICIETDLNAGQVWMAWKYHEIWDMEEAISKLKDEINKYKRKIEGE